MRSLAKVEGPEIEKGSILFFNVETVAFLFTKLEVEMLSGKTASAMYVKYSGTVINPMGTPLCLDDAVS